MSKTNTKKSKKIFIINSLQYIQQIVHIQTLTLTLFIVTGTILILSIPAISIIVSINIKKN